MQKPQPPSAPWKKGKNKDMAVYTIEVHVCEQINTGTRKLYTYHDYQSEEDSKIARSLQSSGEEQSAHALLLNALRREFFVETIVKMNKEPQFLKNYIEANKEEKHRIETELATNLLLTLTSIIRKMSVDVVREILARFITQNAT